MAQQDDQDRKRNLERMVERAKMRSIGEEENSEVIDKRVDERMPKSSSTPAPARGIVAILNTLPPWGRVIVLLMLGALAATGALGALWDKLGWFH